MVFNNSSCDSEIGTQIGKANSTVVRLNYIWKDKGLSTGTKMRLCDAVIRKEGIHGNAGGTQRPMFLEQLMSRVEAEWLALDRQLWRSCIA